jgi:hypothetical protein
MPKRKLSRPKLDAPIPGEFDFGYGFKVRVVIYPQLRGADGEWCGLDHTVDPMTIRINGSCPLWRQHEVLAHELVHAALDFFQWLRDYLVDDLKEEAAKTAAELEDDHV